MSRKEDFWSGAYDPPPAGLFRYEKRLVGFVDILGFKELVSRSRNQPEILGEIVSALTGLTGISEAAASKKWGAFDTQLFSDCYVVSCPYSEEIAPRFFSLLNSIAWQLMPHGCWIRGAVTIGDIYVRDGIVIGPALVRAAELESHTAIYPRIVVSAELLDLAKKYAPKTLTRDDDGVFFLNYVRFGLTGISDGDSPLHTLNVVGARRSLDKIKWDMESTTENPRVYSKVRWLAAQWQRVVDEHEALSEFSISQNS